MRNLAEAGLGMSKVGGPPEGWREVEHMSYVRPGFWRADYELRPNSTVDFFSEPLDELRAELRNGLDRFRAECAPKVGPEVTRRGAVVSEPTRVPVDPTAYLRHHLDLAAEACKQVLRGVGEAFETVGRSFRNAFGGEQ